MPFAPTNGSEGLSALALCDEPAAAERVVDLPAPHLQPTTELLVDQPAGPGQIRLGVVPADGQAGKCQKPTP